MCQNRTESPVLGSDVPPKWRTGSNGFEPTRTTWYACDLLPDPLTVLTVQSSLYALFSLTARAVILAPFPLLSAIKSAPTFSSPHAQLDFGLSALLFPTPTVTNAITFVETADCPEWPIHSYPPLRSVAVPQRLVLRPLAVLPLRSAPRHILPSDSSPNLGR
jgi:hypothetical protein